MSRAFRVGDRVSIMRGRMAGARGRITQVAHADVRPVLDWVVRLDGWFRDKGGASWSGEYGFADTELGPWTVPDEGRPYSVGALQHPAKGSR